MIYSYLTIVLQALCLLLLCLILFVFLVKTDREKANYLLYSSMFNHNVLAIMVLLICRYTIQSFASMLSDIAFKGLC